MIQTTQLRIGNWISFKELWIGQVSEITEGGVIIIKGNKGIFMDECFYGIELTPDILEKCTGGWHSEWISWTKTGRMEIGFQGHLLTTLDSLHEYQNFVFAIYGNEIDYKP